MVIHEDQASFVTPRSVPVLLTGLSLEVKDVLLETHFMAASLLVTGDDIRAHTPNAVVQRASVNQVGKRTLVPREGVL